MSCLLQHGDCMELLKNVEADSVDCVLCDLPYGVTEHEWDQVLDGQRLFSEYKRVCKQNANVILFCQIAFANYLMNSTYKSEFSHCLIWCKENKTRHLSTKHLPLSQYEMVLVFRINKYNNKKSHSNLRAYFLEQRSKCGKTIDQIEEEIPNRSAHHWFRNSSDYRIPTEENYRRLQEIVPGYFTRSWVDIKAEFMSEKKNEATYNGKNESDLLYFELKEKREHPTQKPVNLLEYLLKVYTNEGETVLDNCMGSGSTGVACVNTGRNFIGFELDKDYFDAAKRRIENAITERKMVNDE